MKRVSFLFCTIICLSYFIIGCKETITEVQTIYEEVFIETPIGFPNVHFYDEHNNEITDTLFINFHSDGIVEGDQKVIHFSFTIVIKFDNPEEFKTIDQVYYDTHLTNIIENDNLGGFYSSNITRRYPPPYSILTSTDSVVSIENHSKYRSVIETIPIDDRSLFRFNGLFYSTDSLIVFGKRKSFVIHNLN